MSIRDPGGGVRARRCAAARSTSVLARYMRPGTLHAGGAAAAVALRAPALVPEEVPLLRLQLARGARRARRAAASSATSTRWSPTSRRRCPSSGAAACTASSSAAARPACSRPRRSTGCSATSARACRSSPTARSRWRPTPAPSSATASAPSAPPACTRLSIGVQSFDDAHLAGARPRARRAPRRVAAVDEAADAFDTFNLDLMYALPGQTLAELRGRPRRRRWRSRRRTSRSTT